MIEGRKYTFRVAYMYPDHDAKKIECLSWDKGTNQPFYLLNTGEVKYGTPTEQERKNIVSYVITQKEKWEKKDAQGRPTNGSTKLFGDFSYYNEEVESKMPESQKKANMLMRKFHGFIQTHESFRIVDKKTGNNANRNLSIALYELEDIGAETLQSSERNKKITHLNNVILDMLEDLNNPNRIIDLSFALGIVNVHLKTKEDLYNIIVDMIKINPDRVQDMVDSQKQWLYSLIEKGINLPIGTGTETAITLEGEYYSLNGATIGKNTEELVRYFETNSGALTLLEQKLGTYREKVVLPKNQKEAPVKVDDHDIVEEGEEKEKYETHKAELKKKVYASVYAVSKNTKGVEKHKVFIDGLKDDFPRHIAAIDEFNEMYCEQFKVKA